MIKEDYGYKNLAREDMEVIARGEEIHKRMYEQIVGTPKVQPITLGQNISDLLDNSREQNKLLLAQNKLLQEEKEQAQKEARNAKIKGWISFGVNTILSIGAILIALFKK